jgi:UTP--glucose-1-phosphate uridylyltransferase
VANLDILGATLDPAVLGWHLAHGKPVTCEVVDKVGSDRGGIPVRLDRRPVVLEEFRLPEGFDPTTVRVFNTNTFVVAARALLQLDMDWTFFTVNKKVEGRPVIQFERLLGEVTSALETRFVRVPREGAASRFLPVKDQAELQSRQPELETLCRSRGMLR